MVVFQTLAYWVKIPPPLRTFTAIGESLRAAEKLNKRYLYRFVCHFESFDKAR